MAQNLISSGPELDWMAEASPNQSARLHFGLKRAAIAMKSIECGPSMRRLRSVFICMGADKSAISGQDRWSCQKSRARAGELVKQT